MSSHSEPITLGERLVTAALSAIASAITLACYLLVNLVLSSKSPSGPPVALFEFFASEMSLGIICVFAMLGFGLGSERMSKVFSVFWGTSELWQEAWFNKVMAFVVIAIAALVLIHLTLGFGT